MRVRISGNGATPAGITSAFPRTGVRSAASTSTDDRTRSGGGGPAGATAAKPFGTNRTEAMSMNEPHRDAHGEWACEHGTAMDVHCCGCHSGFLFDMESCFCDQIRSCRHCREQIRLLDGDWCDRETHLTCESTLSQRHEPTPEEVR